MLEQHRRKGAQGGPGAYGGPDGGPGRLCPPEPPGAGEGLGAARGAITKTFHSARKKK